MYYHTFSSEPSLKKSTILKRPLMALLSLLIFTGLQAASDKCPAPTIATSTGSEDVCPGVSTVTITAGDGMLISYTTDETDPSTEAADAVAGPVTFTVGSSHYEIRAIALADGKEPSDCASMALSPAAYRYDEFSKLYLNKATGYLPGPYLVYAVEALKSGAGYWMLLCEPTISMNSDCMIVEFPYDPADEYPGVSVGESIDYINVLNYDNKNTPNQGGMKRITSCMIPQKSVALADPMPELITFDGKQGADIDLLDYLRVPIILKNVIIVEDKICDEDGNEFEDLVIDGKFNGVTLDFKEDSAYNLRGFVGTDVSDNHYPLHFFVLDYKEAGDDVVSGISDVTYGDDEITVIGGRPALNASQRMYDPMGRPATPANATPGLYIITSPTKTSKIVIR